MATAQRDDLWRVRGEGAAGEGRSVGFGRLAEAVADGVWDENDQVRGPHDTRWVPLGDHPALEEFLPLRRRLAPPKRGDDPEMDITPMIDVTFQLIIFFMITATFVVQKTMDLPPAESSSESTAPQPTWKDVLQQYIVVDIRGDETITVDNRRHSLAELPGALRTAAETRQVVEMALKVDDDAPHRLVVAVLDAAAGAQIEQVHFARQRPPDESPGKPR